MTQNIPNKSALVFKESFIPILFVAIGLVSILVYVNFKTIVDSNQVEIIIIQGSEGSVGPASPNEDNEKIATETPETRKNNPLYIKALAAIEQKNWSDAEKIYHQIIEENPDSQSVNDLGVFFYNQKKYKEALQQFNLSLSNIPVYINAYVNRGLVYTKLEKYNEAISDYTAAIKEIPFHFQAHMNLGVVLLKTQNYEQAVTSLKKASALTGGSRKAKALYNLGLAYRGIGSSKDLEAKKSFLAAVRIRPTYIEARFSLAALEPNTPEGRISALEQYNKVLDLIPQYPPAYFRIAQLKASGENVEEAQQNYLKAIQYDPNYEKARYNLGLSYLSTKKWSEARTQFNEILERQSGNASDNARIHFQLGRAAYGENDFVVALAEYEQAFALKKGNYEKALLNIGLTYRALKQYKKAIVTYKKLLSLNNKYPQAWYNLGLAYVRDKKFKLAEEALTTALRYNTQYAQAWFNLGIVYKKQNKFDDSINAYKSALDIKPDYRKAKLNLAVRYARKRQYRNAIQLYQQVLLKDDRYASAWVNLGIAQYRIKQNEDAETSLTRVLELQPGNVKAKLFLSRIFIVSEQYSDAIELLQQAVESKEKDAKLRFELGRAYSLSGNNKKAKSVLDKALRLDPSSSKIKKLLSKL